MSSSDMARGSVENIDVSMLLTTVVGASKIFIELLIESTDMNKQNYNSYL